MSSNPRATRMYIAYEDGKPIALIDATTVQQARNYLAEKRFLIRYAEQGDILAAAKAGITESEKAASGVPEGPSE